MLVAVRRVVAQFHAHIFHAQADINTVVLGHRDAHHGRCAKAAHAVIARIVVQFVRRIIRTEQIVGHAHAVGGEIRVGERQVAALAYFTTRQIQAGRFARTEQIVLRHAGRQHHAVVLRPADTGVQAAGGAFFHHHVHVHLLLVFGHGGHVGLHVFKITQLAQAFHGTVDFGLVVCRAFHLAQFAADDFVARFVVAADVDVAHSNAVAQSSLHFDIDKMLAVFFAACRRRRYLRLRVTGRLQFQTDFGQHFVQFVQIAQFACSDGRQMALN